MVPNNIKNHRCGRRYILSGSFCLSAASLGSCVLLIFLDKGLSWTKWLAFLAKVGSTFIYQGLKSISTSIITSISLNYYRFMQMKNSKLGKVVYLCAAELFPTPIRSMATSLGMVFGTLGGFMSPYVIEIKQEWGPYAVFGGISLIGSISKS